jgi:hypothetical protein
MLRKNKDTVENREFWEYVEKTSAEVQNWPAWKIGGPNDLTIGEYEKQKQEALQSKPE